MNAEHIVTTGGVHLAEKNLCIEKKNCCALKNMGFLSCNFKNTKYPHYNYDIDKRIKN